MGEYHTVKDPSDPLGYRTVLKLGTMDDWRYVRRPEVVALRPLDAGQSTDIGVALVNAATLYRFPWPDEDGDFEVSAAKVEDRDMERTSLFAVPSSIIHGLEHDSIVVPVKPAGSLGNVNVWIPCLQGLGFNLKASVGLKERQARPLIWIVGERYAGGVCRTIFACAYCARRFSVSVDDLEVVRREFEQAHARDARLGWGQEVADRFQARQPVTEPV